MKFIIFLVLIILSPAYTYSQYLDNVNSQKYLFKNEISKANLNNKFIREAKEANKKGQYKKAVSILENFLLTNNLKDDLSSDLRLEIYLQLSYAYKNLGLLKKSEYILKNLLEEYEESNDKDTPELSNILNSLGMVYLNQEKFEKSEELFLKALIINENFFGRDHIDASGILINLGIISMNNGKLIEAESLLRRALEINTRELGENDPVVGSNYGNLGKLYFRKGLFREAEESLLKAKQIYEDAFGYEHPFNIATLNELSLLYSEQGLYNKAQDLISRALLIAENSYDSNHPETALVLYNLGNLLVQQGLYVKAVAIYGRALNIQLENFDSNFDSMTANIIGALGDLNRRAKIYDIAEDSLLKSLEITENIYGKNHQNTAVRLNNLGVLYQDQNQYSKAEYFYKRALDISKERVSSNDRTLGIRFNNLARLYQDQGFFDKSEPLLKEALKINKNSYGKYHPKTKASLLALAFNNSSKGNHLDNKEILFEALDIEINLIQRQAPFLPLNERESFLKSVTGGGYSYDFSYAFLSDFGKELALVNTLNKKGLLEEIERKQFEVSKLSNSDKLLIDQIKSLTQLISSENIDKSTLKNFLIKKENIERKLYSKLPQLKPSFTNINQVAEVIPKRSVLLEFKKFYPYFGFNTVNEGKKEERYLCLVLNSNGVVEVVDLGVAKNIDLKIQEALSATEEGLSNAQDLWVEIGDLIIKPLNENIKNTKTLFISPDSELNRIPFAAIGSHKYRDLLGEIFDIRILTTGRELINIANDSKGIENNSLIVANPAFNLIKNNNEKNLDKNIIEPNQKRSIDLKKIKWESLPGTELEGKAITRLIEGKLLTKEKASVLNIQNEPSPKVLHIASHSYFLPNKKNTENPLLKSGVVLAGANEPNSNPFDDGYLTALEVAKLNLQNTELVVISGCESIQGDFMTGEGVYGLKRAIAVAGASSSLLSLWKVSDQATALFMESYYKKLVRGDSRAEALSSTQEEFKNHTNYSFRHPYVWAAFQLSGDWRPISF